MEATWFKPKQYGYGVTPKNWKGWLASTLFAVAMFGLSLAFVELSRGHAGPAQLGALLVLIVLLAVGFVLLARAKTDGQWGWRWRK
jgi:hypothetical protein